MPYGSQTSLIRLGHRLAAPDTLLLYSVDNGNGAFQLAVTYRGRHCPAQAALLVSGAPVSLGGTSIGNGQCTYDFPLNRAQADRAAQVFGIVSQVRSPHGERISARFSPAATVFHPGAPMEVHVDLTNPTDAPPVQRGVGCMRFSFDVDRDTQRVTTLSAGAQACPVGFVPLAAGASGRDTVDVGRWANIQTPGHYRLQCRYETDFAADGIATLDSPSFSARVWQRTFTGVVEFVVR